MNAFTVLLIPGFLVLSTLCLADSDTSHRVSFGVGVIDLRNSSNNTALSLTIEDRQRDSLWKMRPSLTLLSGDDSSYYIGIGLMKEFQLSVEWTLGVGMSAGKYDEGDSGRDLGNDLEFLSRLSLDYTLNSHNRLRAEIGHLSNASLGDRNPGTEILTFNWVIHFD